MSDRLTMHSLWSPKRWAVGDWTIAKIGFRGDDDAAIYVQGRKPLRSKKPVDHYLTVPGYPPFHWQTEKWDDPTDRPRIESILESCVSEAPVAPVTVLRPASPADPEPPELWGVKDGAAELDVQVSNLDRVAGLPEPWTRTKAGTRLWLADTIRKFAEERRERLGRTA